MFIELHSHFLRCFYSPKESQEANLMSFASKVRWIRHNLNELHELKSKTKINLPYQLEPVKLALGSEGQGFMLPQTKMT